MTTVKKMQLRADAPEWHPKEVQDSMPEYGLEQENSEMYYTTNGTTCISR